MSGTHFKGPVKGSPVAGNGVFADLPIDLVDRSEWSIYHNDFLNADDYDASNDFTLTQITGGSASILTLTPHGVLQLDCPANDQGPIIQHGRAIVAPSAASASALASEIIMLARFALTDADASDSFIGLAEPNSISAVITSAGALTSDNHAGFHVLNADDGVFRASVAGTADTAATTVESVFTLTDNLYVEVAVRVKGVNYVELYFRPSGVVTRVNGAPNLKKWQRVFAGAPTQVMDATFLLPTFAHVGAGTGDDLNLDYFTVLVRRNLTIG